MSVRSARSEMNPLLDVTAAENSIDEVLLSDRSGRLLYPHNSKKGATVTITRGFFFVYSNSTSTVKGGAKKLVDMAVADLVGMQYFPILPKVPKSDKKSDDVPGRPREDDKATTFRVCFYFYPAKSTSIFSCCCGSSQDASKRALKPGTKPNPNSAPIQRSATAKVITILFTQSSLKVLWFS